MSARILRHNAAGQGRFYRASERVFENVIAFYGRTLRLVLRFQTATLLVAAVTLALTIFLYIIILIPQASLRFLAWLLSLTIYRLRVYGRENLPRQGGALLVSNHVSWIDGILLMLVSSRPVRMIAWAWATR